jgi:hypothetical protein
MAYHHERDGWSETTEQKRQQERVVRREPRELKPQEVRRMLWEGATLVQSPNAELPAGAILRSVTVDPAMHASQIHDLLPDQEAPLLCMSEPSDSPDPTPILGLPQRLQDLGYVNVLTFEGSPLLP